MYMDGETLGLAVPNSLYGLCGRKATLNSGLGLFTCELKSHVKSLETCEVQFSFKMID